MPKQTKSKKSTSKKSSPKVSKCVYVFSQGRSDGNAKMKALLGGKGANLAEMCRVGLPVPPGFTITTEVCTYYYANKRTYPKQLQGQVEAAVAGMEQTMAIDMTETGNYEDGLRTYLTHYASEKERRRYSKIFPKMHIPPHCEPPKRRDHLIP